MDEIVSYWQLQPRMILHVGAHDAEEYEEYTAQVPELICWVEANPLKVNQLRQKLRDNSINLVFEAAAWSTNGDLLELKIANNGESSSLLDFKEHSRLYPAITEEFRIEVLTKKLDDVLPLDFSPDFINIDIQGAELHALRGCVRLLESCQILYLEVNSRELYYGCPLVNELDNFLQQYDFVRSFTRWWKNDGWGDAIYVKSSLNKKQFTFAKKSLILNNIKWELFRALRSILFFRK
jgi:FkbM family methyltransferase